MAIVPFDAYVLATGFKVPSGLSSWFLKADGSVDSSTYLTTSAASSTYLPLAGGTLTGALSGTSATFSGTITSGSGSGNTLSSGSVDVGKDIGLAATQGIVVNNARVLAFASTGAATFSSSVTASSFIKSNTLFSCGTGSGKFLGVGSDISGAFSASDFVLWNTGGDLYMYGTGAVGMVVKATSGNVGIGTSSPSARLEVDGNPLSASFNSSTGVYTRYKYNGTNVGIIGTANQIIGGGSTTAFALGTESNDYMLFVTNNAERMRITSGGDVLVGTTGLAVGAKLQLKGNASASAMSIDIGTNGYPSISFQNSSGNQQGYIVTNASSVQYLSISDYRLKQDFKDYNGLNLVNSIKTYDYEWKSDNSRMYGVIAHELQKVLPYAVYGQKDSEQMQGVDYSKIVPVNTKAIQELYTIVLKQQAQIEELKELIKNK